MNGETRVIKLKQERFLADGSKDGNTNVLGVLVRHCYSRTVCELMI